MVFYGPIPWLLRAPSLNFLLWNICLPLSLKCQLQKGRTGISVIFIHHTTLCSKDMVTHRIFMEVGIALCQELA